MELAKQNFQLGERLFVIDEYVKNLNNKFEYPWKEPMTLLLKKP